MQVANSGSVISEVRKFEKWICQAIKSIIEMHYLLYIY